MGHRRVARDMKEKPDEHESAALRHVLVVGGTLEEWDQLGRERWEARRSDLAKVVAHAGSMWLTLRPYERGVRSSEGVGTPTQRIIDVREGCTVIVDPSPDGRERFLAAVEQLRLMRVPSVDEAALAGVLMAPAPAEPDLTVILGPPHQLPPSLVWELAYSEIVFIDSHWNDLTAAHIEHAIDQFSRRHRRFGGIE